MGLTHSPFNWTLGHGERHIASMLADDGYEAALFGFQHVTTDESTLGFEQLFTRGSALTTLLVPQIEAFLQGRDSVRPLYLEVNFEEPHRPFDQGGAQPDRSRGVELPPYVPQDEASEDEFASLQGAIRRADAGVGGVVKALASAHLIEDTLVVFVADHGLAMPRAKGTLYDPGIEVACIFHWPGKLARGLRFPSPVSHVDILPTLLEAAKLPGPARVQGRSFFPGLIGGQYLASREVFAEKTYHSYYDPMRAVRTDSYKLIVNFETAFAVEVPGDIQEGAIFRANPSRYHGAQHPTAELYDLRADPLEQMNLAGKEGYAEVEAGLKSRLRHWMESTDDPILHGPVRSPGHEHAARWLQR